MFPLAYSEKPKKIEKISNKLNLLKLLKKDNKNIGTAKNNARNDGKSIIEIGIKNLKSESKVNEIAIQYKLLKKKPKPNSHP